MSTYRLTLTLDVHVSDEGALRDAASENARAFEKELPDVKGVERYSATDSTVEVPGSALVLLGHQAIANLPGVESATPVEGGPFGLEQLD